MKSKRNHEGYLLLDHRFTPGISDKQAIGLPPGAGQGIFEASTQTCSHCQKITVMNLNRQRERAYCRKCDHYICDPCGGALAATGKCRPYKQLLDELQEANFKEELKNG